MAAPAHTLSRRPLSRPATSGPARLTRRGRVVIVLAMLFFWLARTLWPRRRSRLAEAAPAAALRRVRARRKWRSAGFSPICAASCVPLTPSPSRR